MLLDHEYLERSLNRGLISRGIGEFPQSSVCLRSVCSNISSSRCKDRPDNDPVAKGFAVDFSRRRRRRRRRRCRRRRIADYHRRNTFRFDSSGHSFPEPVPLLNPRTVSPCNLEKFPKLL